MSGVSSSRRLQLKADLSDFFRVSNTGSGPSSSIQSEEQHNRDISPEKKRTTRIPFVGRSGRKPVHSDVVQLSASEAEARHSRSPEKSKNFVDDEHEGLPSQPRSSVSQSSLRTPSLSGVTMHSNIGTKIAARLIPSKSFGLHLPSRKSTRRKRAIDKSSGDNSDSVSDTLSPPSILLQHSSNDSTSTLGSRQDIHDHHNLSSTSRPSQSSLHPEPQLPQPTITISRPPIDPLDDLDEFRDLFTKPKVKHKPSPIAILSERPSAQGSPTLDSDSSYPSHKVGTPSSPALSVASASHTLSPSSGTLPADVSSVDRSTPTPRAVLPDTLESRNHTAPTGDQAFISSRRSLLSKKRSVFAAQQQLHRDGRVWSEVDLDSADESEAVSTKSAKSMPSSSKVDMSSDGNAGMTLNEKRRTLATMPHRSRSVTRRSLLALQNRSSEPPSIPLPSPPSSHSLPQVPLPDTPNDSRATSSRPRAQTMASGSRISPLSRSAMTSSLLQRHHTVSKALGVSPLLPRTLADSHETSPSPTLNESFPKPEPIQIDVDSASPDQLREVVRRQLEQYDVLTSYTLKLVEAHNAERAILEQKINHLEREVIRREKEIKGLTWLVMNGRGHSGAVSRAPHIVEREKEKSDDSSMRSVTTTSTSIKLPLHRHPDADDSGGEYPTSTTDWCSGRSDAEELSGQEISYTPKVRRGMKRLKLVESVNKASPVSPPLSGAEVPVPDHDVPSLLRPSKCSSVSSAATVVSSASSTSSPSPTSVVFPTALSAIPESRPTSSSSTKTVMEKGRTISLSSSASERENHEHRSSKPSQHSEISSSPKTSSRLTPSEAYARNLKLGRPPSIAQVLDQTNPAFEESYGGRSRALLAGLASK